MHIKQKEFNQSMKKIHESYIQVNKDLFEIKNSAYNESNIKKMNKLISLVEENISKLNKIRDKFADGTLINFEGESLIKKLEIIGEDTKKEILKKRGSRVVNNVFNISKNYESPFSHLKETIPISIKPIDEISNDSTKYSNIPTPVGNDSGFITENYNESMRFTMGYDVNKGIFNRGYGFEKEFKKYSLMTLKMVDTFIYNNIAKLFIVYKPKIGRWKHFPIIIENLESNLETIPKINLRILEILSVLKERKFITIYDINMAPKMSTRLIESITKLENDEVFNYHLFSNIELFWLIKQHNMFPDNDAIMEYIIKQLVEYQDDDTDSKLAHFHRFLPYIFSPFQLDLIRSVFELVKNLRKRFIHMKDYIDELLDFFSYVLIRNLDSYMTSDIMYVMYFLYEIDYDSVPSICPQIPFY